MNINKETDLQLSWYEDATGKKVSINCENPAAEFDNVYFLVNRNPLDIREDRYQFFTGNKVSGCNHPKESVYSIDAFDEYPDDDDTWEYRQCVECGAIQGKKRGLFHHWPKDWKVNTGLSGSLFPSPLFSSITRIGSSTDDGGSISERCITAMANSGDFTLSEAILAYSIACERCVNSLQFKYLLGKSGYVEYGAQWQKARTSCTFCNKETVPKVSAPERCEDGDIPLNNFVTPKILGNERYNTQPFYDPIKEPVHIRGKETEEEIIDIFDNM